MNQDTSITDFDTLTFSHPLQMLKAALPYLDTPQQKNLTIGIKMLELRNALSMLQEENNQLSACCEESDENPDFRMLQHMREFCNEKEREWIDLFINFKQAFQLYASYRTSTSEESTEHSSMFDLLKTMMTPEQQAAFQGYSSLFASQTP